MQQALDPKRRTRARLRLAWLRVLPLAAALITCAFLAPALIIACSSRVLPPEDIGLAQLALGVGGTCTTDASCSTNAACWVLDADGGHKECHCVPGYVACPTGCVDLGASTTNCGYCGNSCTSYCYHGECDAPVPLDASSYTLVLGTTQDISAYGAGTHASWANEGAEEFSVNNGQLFGGSNYTDTSDAGLSPSPRYNFADAATAAWDTAQHTLTTDGVHDLTPAASTWRRCTRT